MHKMGPHHDLSPLFGWSESSKEPGKKIVLKKKKVAKYKLLERNCVYMKHSLSSIGTDSVMTKLN